MRQSAAKLSNKMRETRDRLEDDLEETRGVVKDLKDFLSGADCPQLYSQRDVPHWLYQSTYSLYSNINSPFILSVPV